MTCDLTSGHHTNVALDHCEQRGAPFPPVPEIILPGRRVSVSQHPDMTKFLFAAACGEWLEEIHDARSAA